MRSQLGRLPYNWRAVDEYIETNRRHWDEVVPFHVASDFYDVAAFKAGRSTLMPVELAELGDVRAKTLLHLQCHFGLDTLSWARAGAIVTGVDFAPQAISTARNLAAELGIEARFVESNIYDLPRNLQGQFDIVFTSYGVLTWLPDLAEWARIAASVVRPGGTFYLIDGHPMGNTFDDSPGAPPLTLRYPYFASDTPLQFEEQDGSYATDAKLANKRTVEFAHDLGEIITSLIDAGLRIEFLHEFPFAGYKALPGMIKGDDGYWRLPGTESQVPFLFSVKATKLASD